MIRLLIEHWQVFVKYYEGINLLTWRADPCS
jgi:hypothetical protein